VQPFPAAASPLLAGCADRPLLLPVVGVLYPLLRIFPSMYAWQVQRKIFLLYGELKFLEHDLEFRAEGQSMEELSSRLDRIDEQAHRLLAQGIYANMRYTLWMHITLVRERMVKSMGAGK
jgi:hypothetical protein